MMKNLRLALAIVLAGAGLASAQVASTSVQDSVSLARSGSRGPDRFVLQGTVSYELRAEDGSLKERRVIPNLVVDAGKAGIASRINGSGAEAAFAHIAIGIGTTGAAAGNTTLESEIVTSGGQRAACSTSRVTTDVTNDTAQCVVTFNFTGSFAVTESGYLNAASSGVLLARQVFSAINVVNGDSLQVTWKIDVD